MRQSKTRLGIASVVAAALVMSACSSQSEEEPVAAPPVECPSTEVDASAANGPVDGPGEDGIVVVESGFTYIHNDSSAESNSTNVTVGAILENTTDLIARDITVTIDGYIGDKPIQRDSDFLDSFRPGQTMAAGGAFRHFPDTEADVIDHVEIHIEVKEWWQDGNPAFMPPLVVATDISSSKGATPDMHYRFTNADYLLKLDTYSCEIESTLVYGSVVLRDDTGNIIAGDGRFRLMGCVTYDIVQPGASGQYCGEPIFGIYFLLLDHIDIDVDILHPEAYLYVANELVNSH